MCWSSEVWSAIAEWVQAGAAVFAAAFLIPQISQAAKQVILAAKAQQSSSFMAVVSLEIAIADARERWLASAVELSKANGDQAILARLGPVLEAHREQYRNFLDRLCSGIVHGIIPEETYRPDYRDVVKSEAEELGHASRHRHIAEVNEAWVKDRSAVRAKS